jgi:hypothetical protein
MYSHQIPTKTTFGLDMYSPQIQTYFIGCMEVPTSLGGSSKVEMCCDNNINPDAPSVLHSYTESNEVTSKTFIKQ